MLSKGIKLEQELISNSAPNSNSSLTSTSNFSINDSFSSLANFFHANGYIIINDVVSNDVLEKLRNDLYKVENHGLTKLNKKQQAKHQMHKCFFEKSPEMVKFIGENKLIDFVQYLIGDVPGNRGNTLTAHLIHNNAFIVPSEGRGQAPSWHTDDALQNVILPEGYVLPNKIKLPVMVVTCMIWLSDCSTVENGPTFVVPGSHRFGQIVDPEYAELNKVPMCGKAGSVVILNNQLWHRGCENTSTIGRETIQISFGRRIVSHMFKTIMDYQMPVHVIKGMSDKTKERFGYLQGGAYS
jgi:ectoine hydroxylase-related dioxygenase (phytanoyl-CoA dioxygenase family)